MLVRKKDAERKESGLRSEPICLSERSVFPTRRNPGSQSDSSFEDPVYPMGNAETPIAIVIVDIM